MATVFAATTHVTDFPILAAHPVAWLCTLLPRLVESCLHEVGAVYVQPWFYVAMGGIFVVERLWPAMPRQPVFSRGLVQDFLWFNLDLAFRVTVLAAFVRVLGIAYQRLAGGFALPLFAAWPAAAAVAASFVLTDFLHWFHHRVRHGVTAFWRFHAIHHAQRELNPFTDLRVHPVEHLIARTIIFLPMIVFRLEPYALGVGVVVTFYTRFLHANVRTNLGPFRHVLVSPQFHRIHHSRAAQHHERNFGVVLTVWDRLFGTLYPHYDEYPDTGLEEVQFAASPGWSPRAWLGGLCREVWYPFGRLLARR